MRTNWITRSVLASLFAIAATGCFALDEMDKSAKLDNSFAAPGAKTVAKTAGAADPSPAKPKAGAPAATAVAAKPAGPRGDAWWKTASSVTSEESESSIAKCSVGGKTEFMLHDDCIARGGKPQ